MKVLPSLHFLFVAVVKSTHQRNHLAHDSKQHYTALLLHYIEYLLYKEGFINALLGGVA